MTKCTQLETLVGRKEELRALHAAIKTAIHELPEAVRRNCVYWAGAARGRRLLSHFVGRLYELGDSFVRRKVHADGATETSLNRWLNEQTSLRLRGILFTASTQGDYRFFVDHFPPSTHNMARLMKEMMYRCKTPIYLAARDFSQGAVGYAWSLYWNDGLRVHLGPLNERSARELLEICILALGLHALDLADFREEILRLSGYLPGSIVKMCELAVNSRYHYGDRIKIKLVHVDYLMQSDPAAIKQPPTFLQ